LAAVLLAVLEEALVFVDFTRPLFIRYIQALSAPVGADYAFAGFEHTLV
jgi:hypothetical protein